MEETKRITLQERLRCAGIGLFAGLGTGFVAWLIIWWLLDTGGGYPAIIAWTAVGEGLVGFALPRVCVKFFRDVLLGIVWSS